MRVKSKTNLSFFVCKIRCPAGRASVLDDPAFADLLSEKKGFMLRVVVVVLKKKKIEKVETIYF